MIRKAQDDNEKPGKQKQKVLHTKHQPKEKVFVKQIQKHKAKP